VGAQAGVSTPLLSQFVVKVHSRCDLACDHCYVYESVDSSWRAQPKTISDDTVHAIARRIRDHANRHDADQIRITLHGGEPLLLGPAGLRRVLDGFRGALPPERELSFGVQTNGVRLDERFADLFLEYGVRVGVSIDGGRGANDRHRRFADGRSSYEAVVRGIRLLSGEHYRPIYAGLLCTVDVANDPVQVFDDLLALSPPAVDLLLPHATWEQPPPAAHPGTTPYGDWLVACFDQWYGRPRHVGVRLFDELLHALLGGRSRSEAIGLSAPGSVILETDGSIEQTDALKVAFHGAAATGYNVFDHTFDDMLADPRMAQTAFGGASLSDTCRRCTLLEACGGGLYPHRYRADTGFANPSVYCADLTRLITHVRDRVTADLRKAHAGVPVP
jgi:uncharacterized protein